MGLHRGVAGRSDRRRGAGHRWWAAETQQAVAARQAAGDAHISYVDTTGWWDPATMTNDGTHPNDHGHQVLTQYLQPIVAAALGRCTDVSRTSAA